MAPAADRAAASTDGGRPAAISPRQWQALLGSVALAALGYLAFSMWGGWHEIVQAARHIGLGGAAVLLALSCVNYGLRFLRWQLFLGALGQPQRWRPSLLIYLGGFALTTTPGKAGETIRSVFLKQRGVDYRRSMAAFFSERLSDLLAVALLCLLGWNLYPPLRPLMVLAVALIAAAYVLIAQGGLLARWHAAAAAPRRRGRVAAAVSRAARPLLGALIDARTCHAPRTLVRATGLSVAAWGAEALGMLLLLRAFDAEVSVAFACFTYAIGMLAGALSFMPGGLGGAEATMIGLLVWHGYAQPVAVAVTVLVRLATLWFAVLLGVFALLRLLGAWRRPLVPRIPAWHLQLSSPTRRREPAPAARSGAAVSRLSWGRRPHGPPSGEVRLLDRFQALPLSTGDAPDGSGSGSNRSSANGMIAHGLGRSYGDVALNADGTLLLTRGLDRFISFDRASGVLRAEAGVSLDEILHLVVPQGWFLAVSPGTRFVTLAGAVANDVHGKNHHTAGTFGCHVRSFELLRSDGTRRVCSAEQHADWFAATIGGLGLTGLLTWVEIQLVPIASPYLWAVNRRFGHLRDYWALDAELGARHAYSVAWVDCLNGGRGIYSAADFAGAAASAPPLLRRARRRRMPLDPPVSLVNALSLRAFNAAYFRRPIPKQGLQHYERFFYPLDALLEWNRIYGRHGFYQYQCVLPPAAMREASGELLRCIAKSGQGSFLAVFKTFGERRSPGLLSFPRPGATLALDFPNRGESTLKLFHELDGIVAAVGGALYAAKDARMPAELFRSGYPRLDEFRPFVDPAFSSSMWRRLGGLN